MENINLIRKIAWSFHKTTGLDWDDLFQEASLAYCQAMKTYDPRRGAISTYMWWTITSHLKNYLRQELNHITPLTNIEEVPTFELPKTTDPLCNILSREAMLVAAVILRRPKKYDSMFPKQAKYRVSRILHRRGISWPVIWTGIKDLKLAFK